MLAQFTFKVGTNREGFTIVICCFCMFCNLSSILLTLIPHFSLYILKIFCD